MIDPEGLRLNVGIILTDGGGRLLWAKRAGQQAWQFPQGGIRYGESTRDTLWRELEEELGLKPHHVELLAESQQWLTYHLPRRMIRRGHHPLCIGQRQKWFLLRLTADERFVRFDSTAEKPEFDGWCWIDYWRPAAEVVFFKREVYRSALGEFAILLGQARLEIVAATNEAR